MSAFSDKVKEGKDFIITCEFVPGRGSDGQAVEEAIRFGEKVLSSQLPIHAISITDNPGGNPAISPDAVAADLAQIKLDALVHFSCAGINRNTIESRAMGLARKGLSNLLVVTGDYPVGGYSGKAKPVFDLDSVQTIRYLKEMNAGIEMPGKSKDAPTYLPQTNFFVACGVAPFGKNEAELIPQLIKLEKKIAAGADLIIPQLGYDIRRFAELLKYLRYRNLQVPLFGNCYVLSRPVGRIMNKGEVAGCVVNDGLLKLLEQEASAPDKGKQAKLDRAARLMAVFRGMKLTGVHLGGFGLKFQDFEYVIRRSEELAASWHDYLPDFRFGTPGDFYLFPDDPDLTFDTDKLIPVALPKPRAAPLSYTLSLLVHRCVFTQGTRGFAWAKKLFQIMGKHAGLSRFAYFLERQIKRVLFNCQECGDCALFNVGYLCPMCGCAKFQRNGPCGGSRNGKCEADPKKECLWVKAYRRAAANNKLEQLREYVPPVNFAICKCSSWSNYLLGLDHTRHQIKSGEISHAA
jgi:methylenetetrahydrofolate reductase (NADPH)